MLERKTFCVISGASRGLGRAISLEFAGRLGAGSVIAVFARNGKQLEELKQQIEASHPQVRVHTSVVDLASVEQEWYKTIFPTILQDTHSGEAKDFQQAIIINNAASGEVSMRAVDYRDKKALDDIFSLNISSPIALTSNFLKLFTGQYTPHRYVVNLSSSSATRTVKSLSTYGAGKAARLMFFRVLAAEEPNIRVLTYNPGTLDTDMQKDFRANASDPDVRAIVTKMYENGQLYSPQHSAKTLAELLETDDYISGDHTEIKQESELRALR